MSNFSFASIGVLLILPLPLLVRLLLPREDMQQMNALRVPFYAAINKALQTSTKQRQVMQWWRYLLVILAWIALVIALAGPRWVGEPMVSPQQGRNIMMALDISDSMRVPDMEWLNRRVNRLVVVKQVAEQFIKQRQGDRIGLILFGSKAYLQTPLTFDLATTNNMLEDATIGLAGPRTAMGDAIALAVKRLQQVKGERVLILLTDGASNAGVITPEDAAQLAQQTNIKIYTIGIGSNRVVMSGVFGQQVVSAASDLDEDTLRKISDLTGGLFFRAADARELEKVYQQIDQLEPVAQEKKTLRPITELYYWPLAFAILMVVLLFVRVGRR